jgi:pyruvate/2-oxoacid:ferredoxin oxidoreductase beta subunit
MEVPEQKGKRSFINALSPYTSDLNINQFQKIMKRVNNCKASAWKCSSCPLSTFKRCYAKTVEVLQKEAFLKYRDRPEWKKEQERINKETK